MSVDLLEAPDGDVRGIVAVVVSDDADRVAHPLEGLTPHSDVVVLAARVADVVPDLIETVGLLQRALQFLEAAALDLFQLLQVLAISAVERKQGRHGGARGEAHTVVQWWGVDQIIMTPPQKAHVGFVIFVSRQNVANLTMIEDLPALGNVLHHGTQAGVSLGGAGWVGGIRRSSQQGRGEDVIEWEHTRISSGRR